jgi:beta-lactamase class A
MARLVTLIRKGEILSPAACDRMYRLMCRGYYDESSLSQIPPFVQAAHKTGSVDASRSEVVLVNAPHGDYVFHIATKNNKDQRWVDDNEAVVLIRNVSALIWRHFEPKSDWKPLYTVYK